MASAHYSLSGADPGGIGVISPTKFYKSNFFHHNLVQFGKQHSRYKAICPLFFTELLWSIPLSLL